MKFFIVGFIVFSLLALYFFKVRSLGIQNREYVELSTWLGILFSWVLVLLEKTTQYIVRRLHGNIRRSKNKIMMKLSESLKYNDMAEEFKKE